MRPTVDRIAEAVLYEGYLLYPYRPSVKNRHRWTFGGVLPHAWADHHHTGDVATVQTECLLEADREATVSIRLRFLHLVTRQVASLPQPLQEWPADEPPLTLVPTLQVGKTTWHTWQEASEREVASGPLQLQTLLEQAYDQSFAFDASRAVEPLREPANSGPIVAALVRTQQALSGTMRVTAEQVESELIKISVRLGNDSVCPSTNCFTREDALVRAFCSAHVVLTAEHGRFVSQFDPPERWQSTVAGCHNEGLWPVLVGDSRQQDTMLAAPIILYDWPQIAEESPGDLYDGTEIDEILSLRIMTLSDEEKREMRSLDPRAAALLDRTEALSERELSGLHGKMRDTRHSLGSQGKENDDASVR